MEFIFCGNKAADHFRPVHIPDQINLWIHLFLFIVFSLTWIFVFDFPNSFSPSTNLSSWVSYEEIAILNAIKHGKRKKKETESPFFLY